MKEIHHDFAHNLMCLCLVWLYNILVPKSQYVVYYHIFVCLQKCYGAVTEPSSQETCSQRQISSLSQTTFDSFSVRRKKYPKMISYV